MKNEDLVRKVHEYTSKEIREIRRKLITTNIELNRLSEGNKELYEALELIYLKLYLFFGITLAVSIFSLIYNLFYS